MYCLNCGTVNPENNPYCFKCGDSVGNRIRQKPVTDVDIALGERQSRGAAYAPGGLILRLMPAVLIVLAVAFTISALTANRSDDFTVSNRIDAANGTKGIDRNGRAQGLGLAPPADPKAIVRDAAKKSNARELESALMQFFAQNNRYPSDLGELDSSILSFVPNPDIYRYEVKQNPHGYRFEVVFESDKVSGANIVREGEITKYVAELH